jgi:hypothetical protein
MAARHGSLARVIGNVAISAGLALLALQPLAVHASGLPTISASVTSFTTIHVSGFGFGSGDRVEVVDSLGQRAFTTATRTIILPPPPPKCSSSNPCLYASVIPGGRIAVTMPPRKVSCVLERVSVRADDLTTGTRSNVVNVIIGEGLC